jgi:hypothetical protein
MKSLRHHIHDMSHNRLHMRNERKEVANIRAFTIRQLRGSHFVTRAFNVLISDSLDDSLEKELNHDD